jgi:transposase
MLWGGGVDIASIVRCEPMEPPMQTLNDLSRSLIALEPASTLIAVIEVSLSSWLVAGIVPGIERQPLKKLAVDESALLRLLHRWREEAEKAGCRIERIVVAFEAGRDGFWLARWLEAHSIEAHVIHAASVAVSREHRRAKTDRLDAELLKRAFLGWLRGERDHCKVVAIPTLKDEDAKRPSRERESLVGEQSRIVNRMKAALIRLGIRGFNPKLKRAAGRLDNLRTPEGEPIPPNTLAELRRDMERRRLISNQIRQIEEARLKHLEQAPNDGPHAMVLLLARVIGIGVETADMLVHEVLSRNMHDRRAIARYAGLTGSPDESGRKRREKGLARSGNGRVRRGMVQLAWRFLTYQKESALAQWYRARTENALGARKPMIVALARKLLIALWRFVWQGVVPDGVVLRPATMIGGH